MDREHFFIVGAQRSGSTYLYHLCAEHPEIEMAQPVHPEPRFFMNDELFEKGLGYYLERFFPGKPGARILGEKSTSYSEVEKAAQRISMCLPSARIVFILRDPVERAVSNYWFSVKHGFESMPIEQAFREEEQRRGNYDASRVSVSPYAYLKRGRYVDYVDMYERYFAPEQIHLMIYEEATSGDGPVSDLYSFLGVDRAFVPGALRRVINANEIRPDEHLDPELLAHLQEYFHEPNERVFRRLGRRVAEWQ